MKKFFTAWIHFSLSALCLAGLGLILESGSQQLPDPDESFPDKIYNSFSVSLDGHNRYRRACASGYIHEMDDLENRSSSTTYFVRSQSVR